MFLSQWQSPQREIERDSVIHLWDLVMKNIINTSSTFMAYHITDGMITPLNLNKMFCNLQPKLKITIQNSRLMFYAALLQTTFPLLKTQRSELRLTWVVIGLVHVQVYMKVWGFNGMVTHFTLTLKSRLCTNMSSDKLQKSRLDNKVL